MWELDYKENWALKKWCFWTVVLEKILGVPWTARRSRQSILKEISPKCSSEWLMLKLKFQYFGHLMRRADSFEKTLMLGKIEGKRWRGSDQISLSVVSDSLRPHELQHTRPPCPSPTPWAYSNSCPLSQWCHPTISSSVVPFSSHLQYFPASGSFQMSQFFESGGQSIGVSDSKLSFQWMLRTNLL